jgi:hypothetical protein
MTSQEDLRVFRLIGEHLKRIDKQIRWIRMVLWFLVGIVTYMMVNYKER